MRGVVGYQNVPGVPTVLMDKSGIPGTAFFVDSGASGASTSNSGLSPDAALSTIDSAIGKCTANSGDVIFVMPGHAETVAATTGIAVDVEGVSIIGLGVGRSRPAVTAHASAIDAWSVSAANCLIENINFVNAASCTAQINVTAADFTLRNCIIQQGAAPLMGITMAAGADRFCIEGCQFIGVAAGPDCAIDLEAHLTNWIVRDCLFQYSQSVGLDLAGIRSNVDAQVGFVIDNCIFVGMDLTAIDINSSVCAQAGDGIISNCRITGYSGIADIDTAVDAGGAGVVGTLGTDLAAEGGSRIPVTTPA